MMKRAMLLTTTSAYLVLLWSSSIWGAEPQPGSPEAVVSKALDDVNHGRIDEFVGVLDPVSLEEFRTAVVGTIDEGVKRVGEAKILAAFPDVKTVKALKALDAPRLFTGTMRRKISDPGTKKALADTKIDVFGHIAKGDDTAHVIYRSTMKMVETDLVRLNVATLRKMGSTRGSEAPRSARSSRSIAWEKSLSLVSGRAGCWERKRRPSPGRATRLGPSIPTPG